METRERGVVPRKVKGFRDIDPQTNALRWQVIRAASRVYERYGFVLWDTPLLEYAECVGKYLPDQDTPEEGVYSFRNPEKEPVLDSTGRELRDRLNCVVMDNHFLTLRYDLTAPLARLYAERLWGAQAKAIAKGGAKPPLLRRYQFGPVFRFEAKLDPGRFREFWQLDFDTVGVTDIGCDAEVCCVLCDALEALGVARGTYEIRVNNRKLHKGLFEKLGLAGSDEREWDILRVVDKYDKIGIRGVADELGAGRTDPESNAFIPGLELEPGAIDSVLEYVESCAGIEGGRDVVLGRLEDLLGDSPSGREGLDELREIHDTLHDLGYGDERVVFDPSVARGLAYYTGPVFEAFSKLEYRDPSGQVRRFGSICGGGRYDNLVESLLGVRVPATGASIGVDRLIELLKQHRLRDQATGPVLVVVMDRSLRLSCQRIAAELRHADVAAEVYYGLRTNMKAQFAYADSRDCPFAIILGPDEHARGTVSVKDLRAGRERAHGISSREEWRSAKGIQFELSRADLVSEIRRRLDQAGTGKTP